MTKSSKSKSNFLTSRLVQSNWDDPYYVDQHLKDLITSACVDANSVLSMRIYYCLLSDDYDKMLSISITPLDYQCPKEYYMDNMIISLVKKYPYWQTACNPRLKAINTFIDCEIQCRDVNLRFFSRTACRTERSNAIISIAQRKIRDILGDVPDVESLPFSFGPGAAYGIKYYTSMIDKLQLLEVTPEAVDVGIRYLKSCPGWLSLHGLDPSDTHRITECLTIVPGDRLSFVPKTALTDRPIAIGPNLNVLLQRGYGAAIRKKMKQIGLNLNRLAERHRQLALNASKDGLLATIDLSSASDTISWAIVQELLPFQWLDALHTVRSGRYEYGNKWYEYHKFSAMGNGYTFELESLIFYALAYASAIYDGSPVQNISSYGDDILIPTQSVDTLIEVLSECGFTVNETKSFWFGPFRESCGGDFYNGIEVRGFYLKSKLTLAKIVEFRNYLYRSGYMYYFKLTYSKLMRLLKPYISFLSGPVTGDNDHIEFWHYPIERPFNAIKVGVNVRRNPRSFDLRRVWMLAQLCASPFEIGTERSKLPGKVKRYKVIRRRYYGVTQVDTYQPEEDIIIP